MLFYLGIICAYLLLCFFYILKYYENRYLGPCMPIKYSEYNNTVILE